MLCSVCIITINTKYNSKIPAMRSYRDSLFCHSVIDSISLSNSIGYFVLYKSDIR